MNRALGGLFLAFVGCAVMLTGKKDDAEKSELKRTTRGKKKGPVKKVENPLDIPQEDA